MKKALLLGIGRFYFPWGGGSVFGFGKIIFLGSGSFGLLERARLFERTGDMGFLLGWFVWGIRKFGALICINLFSLPEKESSIC